MAGLLLGIAWIAAPLLPLAWLIAAHMVIGSGRWADLPPAGLGLPLITCVAILIGLAALLVSRRPEKVDTPKWPVMPIAAAAVLLAWSAMSLFWSPSVPYGLDKTLRFGILDLLPAYALYTAVRLGLITVPALIRALRWATFAVTLFGLVYAFLTTAPTENARLSAGGTDPITFGLVSGLGILLWVISMEGDRRNWRTRSVRLVAIMTCSVGLVGADSKGPIVAVLVAFLVLAVRSRSRAAWVRLVVIAVVGGAVALLAPASYTSRLNPALYSQNDPQISESILLRQTLQDEAVRQFVDHPLLGVGSGGFNGVDPNARGPQFPVGGATVSYPHLVALEVAAELGLVGVTLLALVVISAVRLARRKSVSDWAVAIIVLEATESCFSGDLSDQRWVWFGLALAAGEAARRMSSTASERVGARSPARRPEVVDVVGHPGR